MSLGLLNNIASIYAQNNLNQTQNSLQNTLQQLSSGSRINSGADDAAGLAVADGLHANVAALNQSTQNVNAGIGLLQTADGALSQVTNLLNRAVTLATESANGTLNANQVSSANQEFQNILTEVGNIGSTTNYNGNTVFSATAKTVFVSDGTSSGANSFSETVGALSASSVGVSAPSAATATATAFVAGASSTSGISTPAFTSPSTPTSNTSSSSTFSSPSTPTSSVGASSTLTATNASDTFGGTIGITYAGGSPVNLTVTAGTTIAQLATQINASGITGLTATVGTGSNANVLTLTGATGSSNTLSITQTLTDTVPGSGTAASSSFTAVGAGDTLSGNVSITYAGASPVNLSVASGTTLAQLVTQINGAGISGITAALGTGSNANKITLTGTAGSSNTISLSGTALSDSNAASGTAATSTFTLANASDTVSGPLSISYGGATAVNLTVASGTTLAQLVTQINGAGISGLTAALGTGSNANKITLTGTAGAGNSIALTGSALTDNVAAGTTSGPGVNFSSTASTNVSQLTSTTAQAVLASVTSAIADVAYQRGVVGANINQLTAASNVASSESVNLTAAESNVRSTNYGQAASDLAKYQVLSQTGISALAQANSVQQEVLKLVQ
jgi:flagellin